MLPNGFQEEFVGNVSNVFWYKVQGGEQTEYIGCDDQNNHIGKGTSMVFNSKGGIMLHMTCIDNFLMNFLLDKFRLAETWDFRLRSGSFLQFDLTMMCNLISTQESVVSLQYSTDSGWTWWNVIPTCFPGCKI